jgi:APA family basic amino acid/polyamine antiporter
MSNEVKNPAKTIPKALFFGTLIVTIVYILANLAYFVILPIDAIAHADADRVGVAAADRLLQGWVGNSESSVLALLLMAGLVVVSTFGCNNGLILAGSRLYKAMADEGLFFKQASELNHNHVPAKALWMQAAWSSVLCLSGSYGDLLNYCTFASLLFYIITVLGVILLRVREPEADRPYKAWAYPISTIIYLLLAGIVAIGILISKFKIAATGIGIVALGWPIYYFFERSRKTQIQ